MSNTAIEETEKCCEQPSASGEHVLVQNSQLAAAQDIAARMKLALQHAKENKHQEAEAELREALKLDPQFPIAHHNLAVALAEQGKR